MKFVDGCRCVVTVVNSSRTPLCEIFQPSAANCLVFSILMVQLSVNFGTMVYVVICADRRLTNSNESVRLSCVETCRNLFTSIRVNPETLRSSVLTG